MTSTPFTVIRSGDNHTDAVTPFSTWTIPANLATTPSFNVQVGRKYLIAVINTKGVSTANLPSFTAKNPADDTTISGDSFAPVPNGTNLTSGTNTFNALLQRATLYEWTPGTTGARYLLVTWSAAQTSFAALVLRYEDTPAGANVLQVVGAFGTNTHPQATLITPAATSGEALLVFVAAATPTIAGGPTNTEVTYVSGAASGNTTAGKVYGLHDTDNDSAVVDATLGVSSSWFAVALELAGSATVTTPPDEVNSVSLSIVMDPSEVAPTTVGRDLDTRWSVRDLISDDLNLVWSDRAPAGDQLDTRWAVRALATDSNDVRWSVLGSGVGKNLDTRWGVRTTINQDVDVRWADRIMAADQLALVWAARVVAGDSLDTRWQVTGAGGVGKQLDVRWVVRKTAGDELASLWRIASPSIFGVPRWKVRVLVDGVPTWVATG